eukprot:CAMPEP_0177365546 /NCGR_PEP_ID=MMETSP0368-20130122/39382_1 /TAXON_ID=447022 ORGANISM="Scrippsiella hangoei-like, Strain SHHI-4" /NCGR_SAMPLE_ID=MMETSP0368 /ASSEMBLY_ACC=CAM_ASM_000363 /LENGTH=156 /DNA_ID=CAMNT_0018828483 /DNA_START=365 /DNA_END=834 /DNA_ORIENTATION=+
MSNGSIVATDDAQHQIVPVLVDLAAARGAFELELEVASLRIRLVLPLWRNTLAEDHERIDDVEAAVADAVDHAVRDQLGGLGQPIPGLPKLLNGLASRDLLRGLTVRQGLPSAGHHLLPNYPPVSQAQRRRQALGIFKSLVLLLQLIRWGDGGVEA